MYAQVIVDVPTYHVDRPFDYRVPAKFASIIEPGMRVHVPFGRRSVLGFVVGLSSTTEVPQNKLKSITALLDLEPVITSELLALAKWLKHETICFEIDALQVMLPSALRAKYEKIIEIVPGTILDERLQSYFDDKTQVKIEIFEQAHVLAEVKKAIQQQQVRLKTVIKQRGTVKEQRYVQIGTHTEIEQALQQVNKRAKKQIQLLHWAKQHAEQVYLPQKVLDDSATSLSVLQAVVALGALQFVQKEVLRDPHQNSVEQTSNHTLTNEQQTATDAIHDALKQKKATTFLLQGITGSGKTEIYLQTIEQALQQGKQAIMLVPEISLTPQMTERFRGRFGNQVAVMHSGLSVGEKFDEWRKIQRGEVQVVVGARSAVFAPFTNLGLIILDEEHESTYKQEDTPRYHARDVAIWRSEYYQCPVVLGSATPALESYARATKGVYTLLQLTKRATNQALPVVDVVDMREELRQGNHSMFSTLLIEAIRERLTKKEQMVLFLNRRGYSSFVMCRDCGTVVQCINCDISLTYHRSQEHLRCHYCGHEQAVPTQCPACESDRIRYFGTGTQKVEEELYRLFPEARVLRMDVDTTRKKGAHEKILSAFGRQEADILLGTQMIAKGLDFPNITLVGVLSADTTLHLADFRASEKTFQLLTQVSGRAGRHDKEGQVIIQSYTPEHYAIDLAKQQHYETFYTQEMQMRRLAGYPPYFYIALIQIAHEEVWQAQDYANHVADYLRHQLPHVRIIGPAAAQISRLQNRYRYQCLIKYKIEPNLIPVLHQLIALYRAEWQKKGVHLTVDLDPSMI